MEALGNIQPVVIRAPQPVAVSQPVLPTVVSSQPSLPIFGAGSEVDVHNAELARFEALQSAARNAPQPLGSQAVTMFKDASGQVITRFRDTNSGKVTYIPEPDLLSMTADRASRAESILNIIA